jgi:hypothetical protein
MKSKLVKYGSQEEQQVQQGQPWGCNAYGCGLPGSTSAGTNGESKFYCRFHFGLKPNKNDQVTLKINQNDKLRNLFDMCTSPDKFFKGDDSITFFGIADKKVSEGLFQMGLQELHVPKNLLKTRRNIMAELDKRTFVSDQDAMPMPAQMDVGNHYLQKIRGSNE